MQSIFCVSMLPISLSFFRSYTNMPRRLPKMRYFSSIIRISGAYVSIPSSPKSTASSTISCSVCESVAGCIHFNICLTTPPSVAAFTAAPVPQRSSIRTAATAKRPHLVPVVCFCLSAIADGIRFSFPCCIAAHICSPCCFVSVSGS